MIFPERLSYLSLLPEAAVWEEWSKLLHSRLSVCRMENGKNDEPHFGSGTEELAGSGSLTAGGTGGR